MYHGVCCNYEKTADVHVVNAKTNKTCLCGQGINLVCWLCVLCGEGVTAGFTVQVVVVTATSCLPPASPSAGSC